jgi:CPA2 family monovalent cation:H+ antiporter-2
MHAAGLSFALGAFVAGLILSESEFSHQALSDVAPLRDIFGLLFFVTVGMLFDPRAVLDNPAMTLTVVGLIIAGKAVIFGVLTRLFGYRNNAPWIVALGLAQIGEFSFVLARLGIQTQALSKPVYDLLLACTVLTMALSPVVAKAALPLARLFGVRRKPAPSTMLNPPRHLLEDHVIVGGAGRTGCAAVMVLKAAKIPVLMVELDHALWTDMQASGVPTIWGDITRPEILHAAGVEKARMLLITMPDQMAVRLCIQRARQVNPDIAVIARATREHHIHELHQLNVDAAVQPEFEGGVEMVRQALARYEISPQESLRLAATARSRMAGGDATDRILKKVP